MDTEAQLNTISATVDGEINNMPFRGTARGAYYPEPNFFRGEIHITERCPSVELLALSSTSIVSTSCSIFSKPTAGATNLVSILGNRFSVDIEYLIIAGENSPSREQPVGFVKQHINLERAEPFDWRMTVDLRGRYAGPTNVVLSPGYCVYLRQYSKNIIEGAYSQRLLDAKGDVVATNLVRRFYRYETGESLPFDEVMNYKVLEVKKHEPTPRQVNAFFRSQAYYAPVCFNNIEVREPVLS